MFCSNCGKEINSSFMFCPHCQTRVGNGNTGLQQEMSSTESMGSQDANSTGNQPEYKPVRKFNKLLLIIPVIVILLAFSAWAVLSKGLLLSPKQYYAMIEAKNLLNFGAVESEYDKYYEKYVKPRLSNPYSMASEISADVDIQGLDENSAGMLDILKSIKITLDSSNNPVNKQSMQDIGITVKGNELIKLNLIQDKNTIKLSIPVLSDKYVSADLSDLEPVYKNLGVESMDGLPKKILLDEESNKIEFKKEDFKKLSQKYGKLYLDSIPDKNVTLERGAVLEIGDRSLKCNKITLKFDEASFKTLLTAFTGALKEDGLVYDLTLGNFKKQLELSKQLYANIPGFDLSDENLSMDKYKEFFNELEKGIKDSLNMPDGLTMTLWTDGNGKLLKRTVDTGFKNEDTLVSLGILAASYKNSDGKQNSEFEANISDKTGNENSVVKLSYKDQSYFDKAEKADMSKKDIIFSVDGSGTDNGSLSISLDTKENGDPAAGSVNNLTKFNAVFDNAANPDSNFTVSGNVNSVNKENSKEKTMENNFDIDLSLISGKGTQDPDFKGKFSVKTKQAFDVEFKLPDISKDKTINLNTVSQEELQSFIQEIMGSVSKFIMDNPFLQNGNL